jgi:hypothetical protein
MYVSAVELHCGVLAARFTETRHNLKAVSPALPAATSAACCINLGAARVVAAADLAATGAAGAGSTTLSRSMFLT